MEASDLKPISEKIEAHRAEYERNEAAVRTQLVEPLLRLLGWDPSDPSQVTPESPTEEGDADYILHLPSRPSALLIEVKNLSVAVRKAVPQAAKYCFGRGASYGVVTNGNEWLFFRSFEQGKSMSERIVWSANILNDSPEAVFRRLRKLSREHLLNVEDELAHEERLEQTFLFICDTEDGRTALVKAVANTMHDHLNTGGSGSFALEDIVDFLQSKAIRLAQLGNETPVPDIEPDVRQVSRGRSPRRQLGEKGIEINGDFIPVEKAYEIVLETAECLLRKKALKGPVRSGSNRYIVNKTPKHPRGNDFFGPKQLSNGWWIEAHASTQNSIEKARKLLDETGFDGRKLKIHGF